jgi:hypothetical protein
MQLKKKYGMAGTFSSVSNDKINRFFDDTKLSVFVTNYQYVIFVCLSALE